MCSFARCWGERCYGLLLLQHAASFNLFAFLAYVAFMCDPAHAAMNGGRARVSDVNAVAAYRVLCCVTCA
jgi:hypothetical protein